MTWLKIAKGAETELLTRLRTRGAERATASPCGRQKMKYAK